MSILVQIEAELCDCDAVVVLITSNNIKSAYVQEIGLASTRGRLLVQLVDKRADTSRLAILRKLEWSKIDFNNPNHRPRDATTGFPFGGGNIGDLLSQLILQVRPRLG